MSLKSLFKHLVSHIRPLGNVCQKSIDSVIMLESGEEFWKQISDLTSFLFQFDKSDPNFRNVHNQLCWITSMHAPCH